MDIAVVDDSFEDRTQLLTQIKKYATENAVSAHIKEFRSGKDFLLRVDLLTLDVVFLDIYLDDINGMEIANKIRAKNSTCRIIFVTTSSAFAVQSYDVNAFYYLLKPYTYKVLSNVMDKLDNSQQKSPCYITVKEGRGFRKILLRDILYVDYCNHYVQIHTENAITSTHMKFAEIEQNLLEHTEFLTCYRCVVVNMNKIKKVDTLFFLMRNGEYVPINRKRVKELKNKYIDYIFGIVEEGSINDGR